MNSNQYPFSSSYNIDFDQWFSAERLEDLPKQAHEIYPKSWLS